MNKNASLLDSDLVSEILEYPGNFQNENEAATCRRMVEELTPEEQEIAARTSYVYWWVATTQTDSLSDESRKRSAMKEARRHLAVGLKYEQTLKNLRQSCKFREEKKVDLLRLCFDNSSIADGVDDKDKEFLSRSATLIQQELEKQIMVVWGQDRDNRPIVHRLYRTEGGFDEEGYILAMIYMAERAFACVEVLSRGREEKIVGVGDYSRHKGSLAPPISLTMKTIKLLQNFYPERVNKVFVMDVPLLLRGFYYILVPFLATETRDKLFLVTGTSQKEKVIGKFIDKEHSTPSMLAAGDLKSKVDLRHFLSDVPFYSLYDLK